MGFRIIRNAPPPPDGETRGRKTRCGPIGDRNAYPFDDLHVGDAFDVPIADEAERDFRPQEYNRLTAAASHRNRKLGEKRFLVRKLSQPCVARCWRIA